MSDNTPDTSQPECTSEPEGASVYSAIVADDKALRAFIVKHYGASGYDIDGRIFCENCKAIFDFIKSGVVPASATRGAKSTK